MSSKDLIYKDDARRAVLKANPSIAFCIDNIKAVDAVEVVRCEKCEHGMWEEENRMWQCVRCAEFDEKSGMFFGFSEYHNGNHFCSYGERREGE